MLLISILNVVISTTAQAQDQKIYAKSLETIPNIIIQQAQKEVKQTYCQNGIQGMVKLISNCYLQNSDKDICMLEDTSLVAFDYRINEKLKSQINASLPPEEFLASNIVEERVKKYYVPRFGNIDKALNYLDKGTTILFDEMAKCSSTLLSLQQSRNNISEDAQKQLITTMPVYYENIQELIKNEYASQDSCRSGRETTEVSIMCAYADAAERKLEKLGYCGSYEDKPVSEWKWHKCSKKERLINH